MNWKSHCAIAFIISFVIFLFYSNFSVRDAVQIQQLFILSIFSALSALVPDLDNDLSKGRKLLDAVVIVLAFVIAAYFYFINSALFGSLILFLTIIGAYFLTFKLLKPSHRGITHTIVSGLWFCGLIYLLAGFQFAVAGLIGYLSHLVADKEIKLL